MYADKAEIESSPAAGAEIRVGDHRVFGIGTRSHIDPRHLETVAGRIGFLFGSGCYIGVGTRKNRQEETAVFVLDPGERAEIVGEIMLIVLTVEIFETLTLADEE